MGLLLVFTHGKFEPRTSMALCCGKHNMVMFPAVGLFLAATFGDIEPYTSMASCGCHPLFQIQTTIVEKSGLVTPAAQWAVPISPPAVGLLLAATFGNFEPRISMVLCGDRLNW